MTGDFAYESSLRNYQQLPKLESLFGDRNDLSIKIIANGQCQQSDTDGESRAHPPLQIIFIFGKELPCLLNHPNLVKA